MTQQFGKEIIGNGFNDFFPLQRVFQGVPRLRRTRRGWEYTLILWIDGVKNYLDDGPWADLEEAMQLAEGWNTMAVVYDGWHLDG